MSAEWQGGHILAGYSYKIAAVKGTTGWSIWLWTTVGWHRLKVAPHLSWLRQSINSYTAVLFLATSRQKMDHPVVLLPRAPDSLNNRNCTRGRQGGGIRGAFDQTWKWRCLNEENEGTERIIKGDHGGGTTVTVTPFVLWLDRGTREAIVPLPISIQGDSGGKMSQKW